MEYILLIHNNTETTPTNDDWSLFIEKAIQTKSFQGGSAISNGLTIGKKEITSITKELGGFMRFETENKQELLELIKLHPVVLHGGSVQLCEMPKT